MVLAGSLAAAVLALSPALGASAEPPEHRTITIDAAGSGPSIDPTMYGAFFEDINQGADGGIYAELVQNRSFEFNSADNRAFTPMTAWETLRRGSDGTVAVVNDGNRLNENNRNYLQIDATAAGAGSGAGVGVRNSGWNAGQKLEAKKKYNYSVWARTSNPAGSTLAVTLETPEGARLALATIKVKGDRWAKYGVTLSPKSSTGAGRLATVVQGTGTVRLDMVSLFPEDTWNGRENGLRKDLAEKIDDLNPGFLRFPGGCIVNTGSYDSYTAPNYTRARTYQWKDTSARWSSAPPTGTSGATTRRTAWATWSTSSGPRTWAPSPCPWSRWA